jgi:hypothetical protein
VKLLFDDRTLQTDLVRADRIVPIASFAGNREPGASPPAQYPAAQVTEEAGSQQYRPAGICRVVSLGPRYSRRFDNHQARDADPLASRWVSTVLAVEIETSRWPAKDRAGGSAAHSRDEFSEPALGSPPGSTANFSSLASMSGRRRLPSTWPGRGNLRLKDGRRFFATMRTASRRSTYSWSQRSRFSYYTGCSSFSMAAVKSCGLG